MLKTLRVTSLVTVLLTAVGVIAIAVLGLKGDPETIAFLEKAGIVDELRKRAGQEGATEEKSSPLVAMAQAFALRIDPPPPPKPPDPIVKPRTPDELARAIPTPKPVIPTPKVQTQVKSDLLATVVYESVPERSLALLKTSGNKQEWFRQGEKVGHLEIQEIRDGSVVFTQGGQNPQEKFVPAKPHVKSLLKSEQKASAVQVPNSGSVAVPSSIPAKISTAVVNPVPAGTQGVRTGVGASPAEPPSAGSDRTTRTINRASQPQTDVSKRIRRVRSVPKPPSPKEQKQKLDKTLSSIEGIMSRQDESLSEEDRKKEDEMWKRLAEMLGDEKKQLEKTIESQEDSEEENAETKKVPAEKKETKEVGKPAPTEPKKP